jgi:hypothetical protein
MKPGQNWQMVDEKLIEIRAMADAAWNRGNWDQAAHLQLIVRDTEILKDVSEALVKRMTELEESLDKLTRQ